MFRFIGSSSPVGTQCAVFGVDYSSGTYIPLKLLLHCMTTDKVLAGNVFLFENSKRLFVDINVCDKMFDAGFLTDSIGCYDSYMLPAVLSNIYFVNFRVFPK